MKVKIAYTVNLEEVEEEVKRILQKSLTLIEKCCDDGFDVFQNLNEEGSNSIDSMVDKLENIRTKLARADIIVADCQNILSGYSNVLKTAEEENEE